MRNIIFQYDINVSYCFNQGWEVTRNAVGSTIRIINGCGV